MNNAIKDWRRRLVDTEHGKTELQPIQLMYRIISRPIARILAKYTFFTPNQVTVISWVIGCTAGILFASGKHEYAIAGSLLLFVSLTLDFVDGSLASIKDMKSNLGEWLGITLERFVDISIIFGIVIGVAQNQPSATVWIAGMVFAGMRFLIDSTYWSSLTVAPYLKDNYNEIKGRNDVLGILIRQGVYTRVLFLTLTMPFAFMDSMLYYIFIMAIYSISWYILILFKFYLNIKSHAK